MLLLEEQETNKVTEITKKKKKKNLMQIARMHARLSNCFIMKVEGSIILSKTFSSLNLD